MTRTGGCLCGAVRYTLDEATAEQAGGATGLGACHCEMCRRHTGGVMLSVAAAPGGPVFESEESLGVYPSSDWAERGFCRTCGSSLFWRLTLEGPAKGLTMVCAGTLDSFEGLSLEHEVYIDKKPDAYAFAGERHTMTEAEVLAAVGAGPGE